MILQLHLGKIIHLILFYEVNDFLRFTCCLIILYLWATNKSDVNSSKYEFDIFVASAIKRWSFKFSLLLTVLCLYIFDKYTVQYILSFSPMFTYSLIWRHTKKNCKICVDRAFYDLLIPYSTFYNIFLLIDYFTLLNI